MKPLDLHADRLMSVIVRDDRDPGMSAPAAQRRVALVRLLAPDRRCALCQLRRPWRELEVDHHDGRTWHKHLLNCRDRVARYWREYRSGVRLRALCKGCNASDGQRFRGRSAA